ncbi:MULTISPECIES: type II toxin-antitoxin system RelE/ParE family toxin [Microbacterium]|uniref:type II toxin-antitoxin system RelE/ParE family toxin n=1 Tax=Microbacterium TaxID=33882 RepID=UPI0027861E2C|nr:MULTISPECIES: type II toxin-antitoxin system RelE/ParE family toxin [Microbacterium]MDQ1075156.1 proteic killer suppression protein [Microbacterium sp. SORGH_AS_0969]MDQ1115387.1 proteic killer suppression protein [Microbacterium testaceum]
MEVRYGDRDLEKLCTNERWLRRKRQDIASRLPLRIKALEEARSFEDLAVLDPLGDWHSLTGDRAGTWAGKLSRNWRLIVRPHGAEDALAAVEVIVLEITDYH